MGESRGRYLLLRTLPHMPGGVPGALRASCRVTVSEPQEMGPATAPVSPV